MSSCPGKELEDYLMWCYDLVVENHEDANPSLQMAEALGKSSRRTRLTQAEFQPIVALAEPEREHVEYHLRWFNEETQSWRDYASSVDWLPKQIEDAIEVLVAAYRKAAANKKEKHWASDLPPGDVFGVYGSN